MEIQVWSDFACPWCALGLARLEVARAEFEHGDTVEVVHRSFELDPRAPARRPETMEQVLTVNYGMSPEQIRAGHDRLTAMGLEVGFEYHFERVQLGSTFDAHRLATWVRGTPAEATLVKGLFAAYFTEGRLLSDHEVLLDVAAGAGIDADAARAVLEGDAGSAQVRADEREAQELGITGVPHYLINGAFAVPGAQDVETLVAVLRRAWERSVRAPA